MADEEENDCCPLCMEELDLTDKTFNACPCGYQVCLWCWHQIKNEYNGLCPACRSPYSEVAKQKVNVDSEDVVRRTKARKLREKSERRTGAGKSAATRKNLANMRVMQRNLVYVIGLPPHFADEEMLKSHECFGQYGPIIKAVVNKSHLNSERVHTTASAYITFANKDDAMSCIIAIDGYYLDGTLLRASFGTTKYCNFFLRNMQCNNPECLYLHELGEQDDSFTKEEMQSALHATRGAFRDHAQNVHSGGVRSGPNFPPPPTRRDDRDNHEEESQNHSDGDDTVSDRVSTPSSSSDAQRKAQSAAAIYKLKQQASESKTENDEERKPAPAPVPTTSTTAELSFSRVVAGDVKPSSASETVAISIVEQRKVNLEIDTSAISNITSEVRTPSGAFEALKMASEAIPAHEPAWTRAFPSPQVATSTSTAEQPSNDIGSGGFFSPFVMGFQSNATRTEPARPLGEVAGWTGSQPMANLDSLVSDTKRLNLESHFPPLSADSVPSIHMSQPPSLPIPVATPPPIPIPAAPSNIDASSSFASIDAMFSHRNESSEALAGLLGVQLAEVPLTHGNNAEAQPKSARSSRFAFANDGQLSGFYGMESQMKSPFGYDDRLGMGIDMNMPPPKDSNSSLLPPHAFGGMEHSAPPSMSGLFGSPPQMQGGCNNMNSGLAFLQQMLPNVNISFGEYPSSGPGGNIGVEGPLKSAPNVGSPWENTGFANTAPGFYGAGNPSGENPPQSFYDPALIAHGGNPQYYNGGFPNASVSELRDERQRDQLNR